MSLSSSTTVSDASETFPELVTDILLDIFDIVAETKDEHTLASVTSTNSNLRRRYAKDRFETIRVKDDDHAWVYLSNSHQINTGFSFDACKTLVFTDYRKPGSKNTVFQPNILGLIMACHNIERIISVGIFEDPPPSWMTRDCLFAPNLKELVVVAFHKDWIPYGIADTLTHLYHGLHIKEPAELFVNLHQLHRMTHLGIYNYGVIDEVAAEIFRGMSKLFVSKPELVYATMNVPVISQRDLARPVNDILTLFQGNKEFVFSDRGKWSEIVEAAIHGCLWTSTHGTNADATTN